MQATDFERVADLTTQLGYPAATPDIARRFARIDGAPNQALIVADDGGTVVGWIHVALHPNLETDTSAEIMTLVVDERQRGRGVGKSLVEAAESWAVAKNCRALRVRSRIARIRAHAFYERDGFQRIKTQHCFEKQIGV